MIKIELLKREGFWEVGEKKDSNLLSRLQKAFFCATDRTTTNYDLVNLHVFSLLVFAGVDVK